MRWETKSRSLGSDEEEGVLFLHLENFFRRRGHSAEEATVLSYKAMDTLEKLNDDKAEWIWCESGPEDHDKYWVCPCCGERSYVQSNYCPDCRCLRRRAMPDIIILPQEDIHKLASGEIVSCQGKDGKVLIMSKMRWLADSTARYKKFVDERGEEFTDEHQAFLEALAGIDEEESDA